METKHWFKVALMGMPENDGGVPSTYGVQRVYVDDDTVMVDLANVFKNIGVDKMSIQLKAFIIKNSRVIAKEPMMVEPDEVAGILMDASVAGLIPGISLNAIQTYVLDLNNHVVQSAKSAYAKTNFNAFAEETGGDGE